MTERKQKNQGMNWIRPIKRLAIYLRDGLACAYCSIGLESETVLTLDHLKVYCDGGSNEAENLVTCCRNCNSARGVRGWQSFARDVAGYVKSDGAKIAKRIKVLVGTDLRPFLDEAEKILARRANFSSAMASLK